MVLGMGLKGEVDINLIHSSSKVEDNNGGNRTNF